MKTDKYFPSVKIKFGTISTSDILQLNFTSIKKNIYIQINLSKGESNSEFEQVILTNIVAIKYRTVHFFYSDGH